MQTMARVAAGIVALFGLAFGLMFLFATEQAAAAFFVDPLGAAGLATLRADMSAFFLVGAGFALHVALSGRGNGLIVPGALYAVAICGRALNLAVAGSHDGALAPMIVEAALILMCWFGWRTLRTG
jgi:hypothetical protein